MQLHVPESVILQRILERWTHVPSGRVYNLSFNPPRTPGLDDVTGEPLEQREDDNPATFQRRLAGHHAQTEPMVEFFRTQTSPHGAPLVVDLEGRTSDEIWPQLQRVLIERGASLSTRTPCGP